MSRDVGKASHNLRFGVRVLRLHEKKFLYIYPSFLPRRMFFRDFYFSSENTRVEIRSLNICSA